MKSPNTDKPILVILESDNKNKTKDAPCVVIRCLLPETLLTNLIFQSNEFFIIVY